MDSTKTPAVPDDDKITKEILLIAGVVVLGIFASILDTTIVNVALPTFQEVFNVDKYSTVAWTVTGYTLALAAIIPITGWAADRFGTKRLYMTAVALFTLGSVFCAFAWSIETLVAFRVLQGLGGGMLMPLGMTILTRTAGPHRMGRLMAILGVPILLGPILGPILGGYLIQVASWHWIFIVNLPIGIIGLVAAAKILPKDSPEPSESFDFVGMLLMSPGLALFLYGVSSIPDKGTVMDAGVLVPMLLGIVLVVSFVFYSFKPKHPLLDLRLFKDRNLTVSTITLFMFAGSFFGALLLVPTYFQQVRMESVLQAGLLVAPQGIGAMLTMPLAGYLSDRLPVGRIVPFGFLGILTGLGGLALSTDSSTPLWHIEAFLFIMGLGMGATMMPIFTSALKTLKPKDTARGTTLINVVQQVAASIGVAIMSVVLTNRFNSSEAVVAAQDIQNSKIADREPDPSSLEVVGRLGDKFQDMVTTGLADAFHTSYLVALAIIATTLIPVFFLPRKKFDEELSDEAAPTVMMH